VGASKNGPGHRQAAGSSATADDVVAVEPVLRRVVAARVRNPADVDDLVQDAMLRLLAARPRWHPRPCFPTAL
jgi:DNA-directed RNA polymerase specialized sigma24 family protein